MSIKVSVSAGVFAVCLFMFGLAASVLAQTPATPAETPKPQAPKQEDLMRDLGLSPEQLQQIQLLNAQRKPFMEQAQKRLREANRSLDEAIYADQVNDQDFQERLKAVQSAQADVAKIRFHNELAVRRILSPEQLQKFRELRRNFEERRQQNVQNQRPRPNAQRFQRRVLRQQGKVAAP